MTHKTYLTVEEMALRFGVNTTTIYRLAQQGKLPGFKVGNQWRFNEEHLKNWESRKIRETLREEDHGSTETNGGK